MIAVVEWLRAVLPAWEDGGVWISERCIDGDYRLTYTTPPHRDGRRFGAYSLISDIALCAASGSPRALAAFIEHELTTLRRTARQQQREWRRRCDPVWIGMGEAY